MYSCNKFSDPATFEKAMNHKAIVKGDTFVLRAYLERVLSNATDVLEGNVVRSHEEFEKFIENNKLWGEMVVKPQLDDVDGLNWAFGIKLMDNHWEDGKMASFNGISFDGFDSLNSLMKANSYNENPTPNKLIEKFSKEVQKRELNDFASARKTSVWKVIDNTWN